MYLHSVGVVHRDMSSSNVLMTAGVAVVDAIARSGTVSIAVAKVSDFGLSRPVVGSATGSTGNCFYLAPEVFRGEDHTEAADVFSFAIVAWETLAGRKPHDGMPAQKCAYSVSVSGLRPDPRLITNAKLRQVVQKMWVAEAAQRPRSKQVWLELKTVIDGLM